MKVCVFTRPISDFISTRPNWKSATEADWGFGGFKIDLPLINQRPTATNYEVKSNGRPKKEHFDLKGSRREIIHYETFS